MAVEEHLKQLDTLEQEDDSSVQSVASSASIDSAFVPRQSDVASGVRTDDGSIAQETSTATATDSVPYMELMQQQVDHSSLRRPVDLQKLHQRYGDGDMRNDE